MNQKPNLWGNTLQASKSLESQDAAAKEVKAAAKDNAGAMALGDILERPGGDTRTIHPDHAESLALSLEALGLLEPLVVDNAGHLLAGGHRLAALRLLEERGKWGKPVPVRVMDFDACKNPEEALAVEVAENAQRRDYSPKEVKALADRLKAAGFKADRGKPKAGERALFPALADIVGKSPKQLRRYLAEAAPVTPEPADKADALQVAEGRLAKAVANYLDAAKGSRAAKVRRLVEALGFVVEELELETKDADK